MKSKFWLASLIFISFILSACNLLENPTAPTRPGVSGLPAWYPCVGVQTPGFKGSPEFEIQFEAMRKLHSAGRMKWIRLGDVNISGVGIDYAIEAKRMGLNVFAILDIVDLDAGPSWEYSFDQMKSMFPQVDIWEIGGEISNRDINPSIITPEEYMQKFKSLYHHVRQRHPGTVLASAPTEGNARGPQEFQRFIELGLLDMDVIIAVNVYDFSDSGHALQEYASLFSRHRAQLSQRRIWVTETGSQRSESQVGYVENFYPKIINSLHPEMMCWYIMWAGDNSHDKGFSLIYNLSRPPVIESDLFKMLTGGLR